MMLLSSPCLQGIKHGFSTRLGGVSEAPYDSLNLGKKWGDAASKVAENLRRFANAGGFSAEALHVAKQVHGDHVHTIEAEASPSQTAEVEADALVAQGPAVLAVSIADCVPILLWDPATGVIGAAHAGWRGTVARIAEKTVERMIALGAHRTTLRAALGPSICARCFEVGDDVAAEFPGFTVTGDSRKPHVDLHAANAAQLTGAGLQATHVDASPPCTCHEPARFFSYRRDHGKTGSHLAFISLRESSQNIRNKDASNCI